MSAVFVTFATVAAFANSANEPAAPVVPQNEEIVLNTEEQEAALAADAQTDDKSGCGCGNKGKKIKK